MKNNKGITLVALIITIIVMLILVAVSVSILINSDLLGTAEKAGNAWENADDHLDDISKNSTLINGSNKNLLDYLDEAGVEE